MATNRETDLIDAALARFGELTGFQATQEILQIRQDNGPNGQALVADGRIRVAEGNRQWTYVVECKAGVDRMAILHGVHNRLQRFKEEGLFVAPYLTPELAKQCQEMGLQFLDTAGNAYLRRDGLYVLIMGQKPDKALLRVDKPMRAFDRTGLRVVFALLADPALLQAPYRDMAKAAGVALGTVGWILTDLREHGFLVEDGEGQRRWIDQNRAWKTWVNNYPLRLRERLHVRRFTAKENDWWETAKPEDFGGCWGGEVAAAKLLGELIPKTATVYLPEERNAFLAKHRLRADPQGAIEVLETFWNFPIRQGTPEGIAPPLLVYADLLTIGDPRTMEQARRIHDHYLA